MILLIRRIKALWRRRIPKVLLGFTILYFLLSKQIWEFGIHRSISYNSVLNYGLFQKPDIYNQILQKLEEFVSYPDEVNFKILHEESFVYYGSQNNLQYTILKKVADKLQNDSTQQTFRVATLGGSMSVPHALKSTSDGYHQQFIKWLKASLGAIGIEVLDSNAAIGATGSIYFDKCVHDLIDMKLYDLVFLEFSANEGVYAFGKVNDTYFEHLHTVHLRPLIEKLLRSNPRMQIVLILLGHPYYYPNDFFGNCSKSYPVLNRIYGKIAEDYQAVALNYQHLFCNQKYMIELGYNSSTAAEYGQTFSQRDNIHPSEKLHRLIKELVVNYMKRSISESSNIETVHYLLSSEHSNSNRMIPRNNEQNSFFECFLKWKNDFQLDSHVSGDLINSTSGWAIRKDFDNTRHVRLEEYGYSAIFNYSNFYGNLIRENCGEHGAQPYLSAFNSFQCKNALAVDAFYKFNDGFTVDVNYTILPVRMYYAYNDVTSLVPKVLDYENLHPTKRLVRGTNRLFPKNRFCTANTPKIEYLTTKVHLIKTDAKGCLYYGIVMEYKCCN